MVEYRKQNIEETEEKIAKAVTRSYINSRDFNGLSATTLVDNLNILSGELRKKLTKLIKSKELSISLYVNPFIKAFDWEVEKQLQFLKTKSLDEVLLYPTTKLLKGKIPSAKYKGKSFSRLLLKGYPQFHQCYFELSVLERYRSDPRYDLDDDGTSLSLSIKNSFYLDKKTSKGDKIYIQTFSYAYGKKGGQVVMVFLRYLHDLSARHQKHWESHLIEGEFLMDKDYYRRSFLAEFTENRTLYEAFLEEQRQINKLCEVIGKPPLFKKTYKYEGVADFNILTKPTLKNFENFAHLLDKLISENINKVFFEKDIPLEDGKGVKLGTIKLLENWLSKHFRLKDPTPVKDMFENFKNIRKLRQKPAHLVEEDEYNEEYFAKQQELMKSAYKALRFLRLILVNHPLVRRSDYKPPGWLHQCKFKL